MSSSCTAATLPSTCFQAFCSQLVGCISCAVQVHSKLPAHLLVSSSPPEKAPRTRLDRTAFSDDDECRCRIRLRIRGCSDTTDVVASSGGVGVFKSGLSFVLHSFATQRHFICGASSFSSRPVLVGCFQCHLVAFTSRAATSQALFTSSTPLSVRVPLSSGSSLLACFRRVLCRFLSSFRNIWNSKESRPKK